MTTHAVSTVVPLPATVPGTPPPQDCATEAVVLGTCLIEVHAFSMVRRYLRPEAMYLNKHRSVFCAMEALFAKHEPIDLLTVTAELRRNGMLLDGSALQRGNVQNPAAVMATDLLEFTNRVSSSAHLEAHCRILYELHMRRKAVILAQKTLQRAYDPGADIFDTYDSLCQEARVTIPARMMKVANMNDVLEEGSRSARKRRIIGNLVKENEVVFLFGDEGTGKSVLAFQMGDAASQGSCLFKDYSDPDLLNECEPLKTILVDFELEADELFERYSHERNMHRFNEHFLRAFINPDFLDLDCADEVLIDEIQLIIEMHRPKFLIVDNVTYITSESQDPKIATRFMKRLLALQRIYRLTILVIAHTPKRDMSLPIESRHLAGAKNLSNFAKSIVAVSGSKQDADKRYIKHIKCRNGRKVHGEDNVIECVLNKPSGSSLLQYEFYGFSTERAHLMTSETADVERQAVERAVQLHEQQVGYRSIVDILRDEFQLNWSHTTVARRIREFKERNRLPF